MTSIRMNEIIQRVGFIDNFHQQLRLLDLNFLSPAVQTSRTSTSVLCVSAVTEPCDATPTQPGSHTNQTWRSLNSDVSEEVEQK